MKHFSFILSLLISCATLWGCEKEEEIKVSGTDYLIFGHYYGECLGESCVKTYRLEKDRLLEITNDRYASQSGHQERKYAELSQSAFSLVKDLPAYFPEELLKENNETIGQPDAGDWGGLYIEYNYEGIQQFWFIDLNKNNVPAYLHDFIDKVREKIALINN